MMKVNFEIQGLSCGHCVNSVSNILKEVKGISNFSINLPNQAMVEFDESIVTLEKIKQEINDSEIYKAI